MKNFKVLTICFSFLFVGSFQVIAQEEETEKEYARAPFESAVLIENQTVIVPYAGTLEWDMVHRFGTMQNGKSDLYGLYGEGANIRMGLTYSIKDNLALGVGFTKYNQYVDFNLKYAILKQTKDWSMPVSLTYYGNMGIDSREDEQFESIFQRDASLVGRISTFSELIIATRISKKLSLQLTPSFSYFNSVEPGMNNSVIGLGLNGRYKVSSQSSIIFDYNQQLTDHPDFVDDEGNLKLELAPNVAFGFEVSTSSHAFQVFVSTFQGILPQHNIVYNTNEFDKEGLLIGFNITRLWSF
ncbi:MAG: hypothetical protein GY816_05660 [Cytophagales bacterium]|nr:hypothetical protein [Cytophagales bacterium]